MRAFTHWVAVVALSFSSLAACSEDETCQSGRDCAPGRRCESGMCVLASGGNATDAGPAPDLGVPRADAAQDLDAEVTDADLDGGTSDATSRDAAPSGPDGGTLGPYDSGTDGGLPDSRMLPSSATVIFGDYQSDPVVETGFAELLDRTGVVYSVLERRVPDFEGGTCTVRTARIQSGTPRGIPARQVTFAAKTSGMTRVFSPVAGVDGRFEPATQPTIGFFNRPGDIFMHIESTGAVGGIEDYRRAVGGPSFFQPLSPALGTTILVLSGIDLRWNVNTIGGETTTFVELYDARREVVLSCVTMNDGAYQVPPAAVAAWYSEAPAPPATLDVGYEIVPPLDDAQLRGGGQIPVVGRFQQGARYAAQ